MAQVHFHPDPYNGWSIVGGPTNNMTAHSIMTDTSTSWELEYISPYYRRYRRRQ